MCLTVCTILSLTMQETKIEMCGYTCKDMYTTAYTHMGDSLNRIMGH